MSMRQDSAGTMMGINLEKMTKDILSTWNSHDVEKIVSFFTDDCIYEDVGNEKTYHGKTELREYIKNMFLDYPDFRVEQKSWFSSSNNDKVAFEDTVSGTHKHSSNPTIPATNKRFSQSGVSISELRNGKIHRYANYFDRATMLQQIGLMPTMGTK